MADLSQILADVPETAGSYSPAAEALGADFHEGHLGDPQVNGEHVLGHVGLQDLLSDKLGKKIVRAADSAEDPSLAGIAGLGHVEKVVNTHSSLLESRAKRVYGGDGDSGEEKPPSHEAHQELIENLSNLANNPKALIERLSAATHALHAVAPHTAASTQETATRAIQFLASKIRQPDPDPLGEKYEPSSTERLNFHRYVSVVEDPTVALHQVKQGTLTPETLETLQTVYPRLYDKMKQAVIGKLDPGMPYQTKMMVSQFLGEPVDSSLKPERILSLQGAFAPGSPPAGAGGRSSPRKSSSKLTLANRTTLDSQDD